MDEILVANFSVFQDVVDEGDYDLVVGDEAWDVDHFWHENPELKRSAYAWVTDFVGWLPMPSGGDREAALTADYNAEMIEHVERFRRVRDAALFVGDPEDVVPDSFGPGCRRSATGRREHYDFSGYVTGFDPAGFGDRAELRRRLGYPADEPVVVVTVGGSGVGETLLRTVLDAFPRARKEIDGLRMLVVCGPRIDGRTCPGTTGVDIRGYVDGSAGAPVRLRRRRRPGRADDDDGARRVPAPVRLRAARRPLRAATPRAAPARPVPGRPMPRPRRTRPRRRSRTRSPSSSGRRSTTCRCRPAAQRARRAAALL